MKVIETEALTKYYLRGKVLGVKDLALDVREGEVFGYIGPNGAGKSTTIRLLLDLIRPSSGSAKILGLDAHKESVEVKKQIGFLPGEIFLPESMTGKECLSYYRGFKERVEDKYVKQLIDRFELDLSKRVSDYSKGNKQKLAIILALMHKPKLLILDEPTSGLDPLNQQTFYDCILETKSWGATTFFSTHILDEAQRICDRVGIIKAGHLIRIEDIEEFRQKNIRDIHITTKADIPAAALQAAGVNKVEKTKAGYHLTTFGKNGAVIKQLASYDIDDMAINQPSLEEVFIRFYKED